MKIFLRYALQPVTLAIAIAVWLRDPGSAVLFPIIILSVQIVLGTLEYVIPARPQWLASVGEKAGQTVTWMFLLFLGVGIGALYGDFVSAPLRQAREGLRLDVWPHEWPVLVQMLMVFFLAEFIWYWIHRAEHRWPVVWRTTGHGAHHSYKTLNAINFGLNHPLELLPLVAPAITIDLLFGVGAPAAGATLLLGLQASFAHANLDLNTRGIGLLLTTNRYHIHHHSSVMEESNTNYGCAVILWDRLFGTFSDNPTLDTGTGPTEPTLWQKFVMPVWEPSDTAVAPNSRTGDDDR